MTHDKRSIEATWVVSMSKCVSGPSVIWKTIQGDQDNDTPNCFVKKIALIPLLSNNKF